MGLVQLSSGFSTSGDRDGDGQMDPKYFLHEMNLSDLFLQLGAGLLTLLGALYLTHYSISTMIL